MALRLLYLLGCVLMVLGAALLMSAFVMGTDSWPGRPDPALQGSLALVGVLLLAIGLGTALVPRMIGYVRGGGRR